MSLSLKMDKHVSSASVQMTACYSSLRYLTEMEENVPLKIQLLRRGREVSLFGGRKLNGLFAEQIGV